MEPFTSKTMSKTQLRNYYKQLRQQLPIAQVQHNSTQIAATLFDTPFWKQSNTVMLYLSFQNEVQTEQIYQQGWLEDKTMLVPICSTQDGIMECSVLTSLQQLVPNRYGIRELPESAQQIVAPENIDLCLIPGIVFDQYGNRIGFGAGYYDRYLAKLDPNIPRIAIAHSCQIHTDILPMDPYDLPMHYMLTEHGLERCKKYNL